MGKKKKGTEQKTFRVVAIPYQKDFRKFGQALEDKMNELLDGEYQVAVERHPMGVAIMAHRTQSRPMNPLEALLGGLRSQALGDFAHLSPDVRTLIGKVIQQVDLSQPETFKDAVRKVCEDLLKNVDNETLRRFTKELDEEVRTHHDHCENLDCAASKIVAELTESIKQRIQMNLQ